MTTTMMCSVRGCPRVATRGVWGRFWAKGYARMANEAAEFHIGNLGLCDVHEPPGPEFFAGDGGVKIKAMFAARGLAEPDLEGAVLFTRKLTALRGDRADETVH